MLKIDFWNIAFTIINILVLYAFMRHFLFAPIQKILDERKQMVERDLDEASALKGEAGRLKEEYEASVQNAGDEAAKIVEASRVRARAEYDKILKQAETDAAKKLESADKAISLEREKALCDLKDSVAGLAMTAAAKLLSEESSPERDSRLYQAFLAESGEKND